MAGRQRTTFEKRERERARQEKQAAKRARRQGRKLVPEPERFESEGRQADDAAEPDRADAGDA